MVIQKYTVLKQVFYVFCLSLFASCQYTVDPYEQASKQRFLLINADLTETYGKITVENSIDQISLSKDTTRSFYRYF